MSGEIGMDLVDAITEWSGRVDEELTEDDIDAILRIQLAVDDSEWGGVDIGDYSAADLADLKAAVHHVDAPDFTAWVIDETLAEFDAIPVADPSRLDDEPDLEDEEADDDNADGADDELGDDAEAEPDDESTDEDGSHDIAAEDPDDEADEAAADEQQDDEEEDEEEYEEEFDGEDDADDHDDIDEFLAPNESADTSALGGIFAAASSERLDETDAAPSGTFAAATTSTHVDDVLPSASQDPGADFFAELDRSTTASVTRAPIELKQGPDTLGPAFLPPARRSRNTRIALSALAVAALVAFVLAGMQLVNNVNSDEGDVEVVDSDADADAPDPDDADEDDPDDDIEGGAADSADTNSADTDSVEDAPESDESDSDGLLVQATPTPVPDLPPAESRAIILTEDGEVWAVDLFADTLGRPTVVYDDDPAATDISLIQAGLAIVDEDGVVHVLSLEEPDERVKIWRGGSLPDAQQIVDVGEQYAVLDATGSISLFDKNRAATQSNVDTVWDAGAGGTPPARTIDVYKDLLPFTIGNGEIRMVVTSIDGNPVNTIWDPSNQPRAFNMAINEHGLLMGVGAGAVARYQWFETGPPLQAVWDPLDGSRLPAIGYVGLPGRTAVVLNNGTVASLEDDGSENVLWDAEVSDLRAIAVAGSAKEVLLTLDGGSVLRVAADGSTEGRGSVWDVTDESVSPATKVLVLDS